MSEHVRMWIDGTWVDVGGAFSTERLTELKTIVIDLS